MESKTLTVAELRERMQRAGLSQSELARRTGIAQQNISAYLRERAYLGPARFQRLWVAVCEAKPPDDSKPTFRLTT